MLERSQTQTQETLIKPRIGIRSGTQMQKIANPQIMIKKEQDFLKGDTCVVCDILFTDLDKKIHHCRVCGKPVCNSCSEKQVNEERSCDLCFKRVQLLDIEKQKKKQIQVKAQFIDKLRSQIDEQREICEQRKNEIDKSKLELQLKLKEQQLELKSFDEQLKQKKEKLLQILASNERQGKNIQVEKGQIREIESENERIRNDIAKLQITIQIKEQQMEPKEKELQQCELRLQEAKNVMKQVYTQQQAQLNDNENIQLPPQVTQSRLSTKSSQANKKSQQQDINDTQNQKDCLIQ